MCSGNIITLTSSYILPVGTSFNADYWSSSNTNVAIVINGIVKGISAGTADISYRVQDSRMCDSTVIKTITVTISLLPSVNISASKTTICEGTDVIFTATSINGGLNPVYQWQKNGVNAGTNSYEFRDNNIGNNDVIFCNLVSNSSACLTTGNASSNKITMTVIPQTKPTITGLKKSFCENEPEIQLTGKPDSGIFIVDGTITTAFKPLLLGHGKHTVIYNSANAAGCSSSEKISVNIDAIIKPEANAGADDISQNGIFVLKANTPALGDSAVWTVLSGRTVFINNIHAPNAVVSGLPDSTKIVLRWTIFHGACVSYSDITIYPAISTNFFAEKKTDKVLLKWNTFYEKNNNYFDIERSQDSFSFTVIGRVKSIGNSTGETQYQFIDDAPPYGKIYYRLKTVDKQSHTSFSRINEIDFLIEKNYFIYPNPFQDYVSFHAASDLPEDVSIIIFGITGRVLKTLDISLKAGINDNIIHTEDLPSGIYFFKILSNISSKIATYEFRIAKI